MFCLWPNGTSYSEEDLGGRTGKGVREKVMDTVRVNRVLGSFGSDSLGKAVEWVDMDSDQCQRSRWKTLSDKGRVVLIDLPRHTGLADQDILYADQEIFIVARMKAQKVLVMQPKTPEEMGTLCYHIGNLHQPCWVKEGQVFTPNETFLKDLAQSLGILVVEEYCVLPQGFATRNRPHRAS